MDRFEARFENESHLGLYINGQRQEEWVDALLLWRSLFQSGDYFIRTCTCGQPGCVGIWDPITVTHRGESIVWEDRHFEPPRRAEFPKAEYEGQIRSALAALRSAFEAGKDIGPFGVEEVFNAYPEAGQFSRSPQ